MLNDKTYYVRRRGKVTGPFDIAELRHKVRTGALSRIYEVSPDIEVWKPIAYEPALCRRAEDAESTQSATATGDAGKTALASSREREKTAADSSPTVKAGVQQEGAGAAGSLQAYDIAGGEQTVPVSEHKYETTGFSHPSDAGDEPQHARAMFIWRLKRLGAIEAYCAAIVILICANLPHTMIDGDILWWWNFSSLAGAPSFAAFAFFSIAASIVLPLTAFLADGGSRGLLFIMTASVGLLLLFIAALSGPAASFVPAVAVLPLSLLGLTIGVSKTRAIASKQKAGGTIHGVVGLLGGIFSVLAMLVSIVSLAGVSENGELPPWAILGIMLFGSGWLVCLGGGSIGATGFWFSPRPKTRKAGILLIIVGFFVLTCASVVAGYGLTVHTPLEGVGGRFLLVQVLRFVVVVFTLIVLMAVGVCDILVNRWFRTRMIKKRIASRKRLGPRANTPRSN